MLPGWVSPLPACVLLCWEGPLVPVAVHSPPRRHAHPWYSLPARLRHPQRTRVAAKAQIARLREWVEAEERRAQRQSQSLDEARRQHEVRVGRCGLWQVFGRGGVKLTALRTVQCGPLRCLPTLHSCCEVVAAGHGTCKDRPWCCACILQRARSRPRCPASPAGRAAAALTAEYQAGGS